MTDFLGYGKEKRRAGNLEILSGRVTFQYVLRSSSSCCVMIRAERGAVCWPLTRVVRPGFIVQRRLSGDAGER